MKRHQKFLTELITCWQSWKKNQTVQTSFKLCSETYTPLKGVQEWQVWIKLVICLISLNRCLNLLQKRTLKWIQINMNWCLKWCINYMAWSTQMISDNCLALKKKPKSWNKFFLQKVAKSKKNPSWMKNSLTHWLMWTRPLKRHNQMTLKRWCRRRKPMYYPVVKSR